jgi:hypothetical protein
MNYFRELQKFIRGDRREEGWISPWRGEQERRRAEEGVSFVVTAKQIKVRQERPLPKRGPRLTKQIRPHVLRPVCPLEGCHKNLYGRNAFGLCVDHLRFYRVLIDQRIKLCSKCDNVIRIGNMFGMCKVHAQPLYKKRSLANARAKKMNLLEAA